MGLYGLKCGDFMRQFWRFYESNDTNRFQVGKVIWCQHLALDDGEVDFDLIEPTGVDRRMDQNNTGIDVTQPLGSGCAAMRRAVIHDPEQAFAGPIRFLSQHLLDQPAKWSDAGLRFTAPYDVPPAHIPCGQILQGASALVFVLDVDRSTWRWGQRGMAAAVGLDAGLLIGAEHVI